MHDSAYMSGTFLLQNPKRPLKGPAAMDQHRQTQRHRQTQLITEGPFLAFHRDRIGRIKPDLANGHTARMKASPAATVLCHPQALHAWGGCRRPGRHSCCSRLRLAIRSQPVGMDPRHHKLGHPGQMCVRDNLLPDRETAVPDPDDSGCRSDRANLQIAKPCSLGYTVTAHDHNAP